MPARPAAALTNETTFGAPTVVFCGGAVVRLFGTRIMWFEGRGSDTHEGAFFTALKFTYFKSIIGFWGAIGALRKV